MKIFQVALALIFCIGLIRSAHCEDADPIKARTDKAKAAYERELDRARTAVLDKFTEREDQARKKGDLKAVNEIKNQRAAFEISEDIQKYFTPQIRATLVEANKALDAVYKAAITDYLRLKKDDQANKLQAEYDIVKVQLAPVEAPKAVAQKGDQLVAAGMVYEGTGSHHSPGGVGAENYEAKLTVTAVDGNMVTGDWLTGKKGNVRLAHPIKAAPISNQGVLTYDSTTYIFKADGSVEITCPISKGQVATYLLRRTVAGGAPATGAIPHAEPPYEAVPEAKEPAKSIATTTLSGQLYPSKGGTFLDNNLIIMCVDNTEGRNKKRLLDFTRGRQVVQLIATEPRFAFPLKDGADKRVRAKVTGRLEGSNRLWLTEEPHEIDRPKEPGLGRP